MSAEWSAAPLGDLVDFINGDRGKNYPSAKHRVEAGIPFINAGHLGNGIVMFEGMDYITPEHFGLLRGGSLAVGDILLCIRGSLGRAARVDRNSVPGTIASSLVIMRPRPEIDSGFLLCMVQSPEFQYMIKASDNGSAQPNVGARDLANLVVDVPPLQTQLAIASVLSAYGELIENNTRRIKILEEMAQSIYKEWFVNFRYPGHENVPLCDSELGPIPEGWEVKALGELIGFHIGGGWGSSSEDESHVKEAVVIRGTDIPRVRYLDVSTCPTRFHTTSNLRSRILREGDLVMEVSGGSTDQPVGRVLTVDRPLLDEIDNDVLCASFCKLIRPAAGVSTQWLYFLLLDFYESGRVEEFQVQSTGIRNLRFKQLLEMRVCVPSLQLVEKFVEFAALSLSQIATLGVENRNLRETRDLLLPRLISGEVTV